MLYHLLVPLSKYDSFSAFNVVRYLTFRTALAALTAMFLSFILGPPLIRRLTAMKVGQTIRNDGPEAHLSKAGTPTMGGSLIVMAILIPALLWSDLASLYFWAVFVVIVGFAAVGFIDDYLKIKRKKGITAKQKLLGQILFGTLAAIMIYAEKDFTTAMTVPFFKNVSIELGALYIPVIAFIIVGTSNAVNLTDGLDGLAIGPTMIAAGTFTLLAYVAGHARIADYLQIHYVAGAGNLSIISATIIGAGLGFLWFNTYPAQVFMGDVGSLPLGGALGALACITKNELLLVVIGGIFVMETVSVIVQVVSFKLTGKRVFAMAPIHHHYELKGWAEPKIIVRFWIIAIILALVSLTSLKLR
ncbi:MAG: phospho-N-acetylmuramoyl-pentapeptide-transferase [Deltaproteobacteria bacterium]|nr:phospho-N-acetylmuramoyl-pentapeptide-transferase [Deltaproteobacteria bacterium]MCB9478732.1 phospho-N-acetylmuramoyl-pentapeptide-transferase [Deltaproteobacteria bacterium]MCB9488248.1 phospho-N-acetylmuramoyl-pentapeptide-transferase [Deltaproteobacteria bacterium]